MTGPSSSNVKEVLDAFCNSTFLKTNVLNIFKVSHNFSDNHVRSVQPCVSFLLFHFLIKFTEKVQHSKFTERQSGCSMV